MHIMFNSNRYIIFMNMDNTIYKTFCMYSIFQIFCQTILQLILTKLYYKEENKKANKISVIFNSINFMVVIITAIISFAPTPFCTIIGQMCSTIYELICTKINFKKYKNKSNILQEDENTSII